MAVKPSILSQVGPISGQMKRSFSESERTQINSMRSIAGTVSTSAGGITGDVTNRFSGISNATQGRLGVSSVLAQNLEATGLTVGTISGLLTNTVSPAVTNHRPLDRSSSTTPTDLSNPANRMPSIDHSAPTDVIDQRRRQLNGSPNSTFPLDIDQAPAYIELKFYPYNRDSSFSPGTLGGAENVVLPLPENFNQSFNIKYDPRDQGFLGDSIGAQTAVNAVLGGGVDSFDRLKEIAGQTGASFAARRGYAALDMINDTFRDVAGAAAGMIPNPHSSIFFQGMDLRTFQWTWKLVPRNQSEAQAIEAILKKIKRLILPKRSTGGITLDYPHMMKPKVHGKEIGDIFGEFRYSMVKGFNVNFSGEGASAFFRDGRPVSIQIGIEFQEVDIAIGE